MTKKLGFKLNISKTPFYTVLKSADSRKDILFTLTWQKQTAEVDVNELTEYALYFIKAGIKSGFISPINKDEFFDYLKSVEKKSKPKTSEESVQKGGDEEDLPELLKLSVSKFKDEVLNILMKSDSKDEVLGLLNELKAKEESRSDSRSSVIKFIDSKIKEVEEGLYDNLK